MSRMSPGRNAAIAVLLCAAASAACGEPQCPGGYYKKDDRCYRIKDSGAQDVDAIEGDDASIDADADVGSLDGALADAGAETGAGDEPDAPDPEAGPPAVDAAVSSDAGGVVDAALPPDAGDMVDAAPPPDAGGDSDAAEPDASTVTCASQPCQNGGSCTEDATGVQCACPEPYVGDRCQAKICPTTVLRTPEDLAKARECGEIQGDLTIASAGIAAIRANDLPYLTTVTGDLTVTSMANNRVEAPRLQSLTLPALREVEGAFGVIFTGAGSVEDVRFPSLARVGLESSPSSVNISATDTRLLDLSSLTTVHGSFYINGLYYLCSLYLGKIATVTGTVQIGGLHNLSPSAVEQLIEAAATAPVAGAIGCCSTGDRLACTNFTAEHRARCGC